MRIRKTTFVMIILGIVLVVTALLNQEWFQYLYGLGPFDTSDPNLRPIRGKRVNINSLMHKLKDHNEQVRFLAINSLSQTTDPRAIQPLIEVLQDNNEALEIRCAAARALGGFVDPQAVRALEEIKNDESQDIILRRAATPVHELVPHILEYQ